MKLEKIKMQIGTFFVFIILFCSVELYLMYLSITISFWFAAPLVLLHGLFMNITQKVVEGEGI